MPEMPSPQGVLQPFRRNLNVNPVLIPIGQTSGTATLVPDMTGQGVTTFKMYNPTKLWVWYRGWSGSASPMPTIKEMGHYIAPGMVDICRTQMPNYIAAVFGDEPDFPIIDPTSGTYVYQGKSPRLIMIYGSGS